MRIRNLPFRPAHFLVAGLLLSASFASAQNTGWRRFDDTAQNGSADPSTPVF